MANTWVWSGPEAVSRQADALQQTLGCEQQGDPHNPTINTYNKYVRCHSYRRPGSTPEPSNRKSERTSYRTEYDKAHTFSPTERITEHRNKNHSSISAGRLFSQPCSVPITSLSLLRGGAKEGGNEVHKKVITSQKNPPLWKTKQNKNHSIIETNDNNSTLCRNQINSKS